MKPINADAVQSSLERLKGKELFLHLETTSGAYAAHHAGKPFVAGAFIRNGLIRYQHGKIKGSGPYRVGLKMDLGWVYAEGLTHFVIDQRGRLLLAGYDDSGNLTVALQLSEEPFDH
ncbi:protein of unknown function DUF1806 [Caldalkalibacillus thermarum TA2.A1]|uniref:YojF family protein n=1 Tax=Caldalkalibacillus thermarum (strain TA2.A1) TaxID=986075 RepID=F5L622_CALTT|nr:YojF family protein [Caldalkalibacillus thermarum]EGL83225.1 protein of unknown function DUF1806 [Caldalkalibacillus thermarum TA2.A1]QZT34809.1 YojF family protein [Caldalkalibacillus thermarum TA2.A1]